MRLMSSMTQSALALWWPCCKSCCCLDPAAPRYILPLLDAAYMSVAITNCCMIRLFHVASNVIMEKPSSRGYMEEQRALTMLPYRSMWRAYT